jgi:hypothetical protein
MLKKMQDNQDHMQIEIKLLNDELKEKASNKEMIETNHKIARVFNNTDKLITALKGDFTINTTKNAIFEQKMQESLDIQDTKAGAFQKLFNAFENKSTRVDKMLSEHSLRFENYAINMQINKWQDKNEVVHDTGDVSKAVVNKMQAMVDEVSLKVHRHSNDQLEINDKIGDLETKIMLLIQAAKNHSSGTENTNIFDGIGDIVTAVDHLQETMKGQYAKLNEFKEVEQHVDTLKKFHKDAQEETVKELKLKKELEDLLETMQLSNTK